MEGNMYSLIGWYTGDSIDLDNNLWRDISLLGHDAIISGDGIGIFNDNTDETDELYLNGKPVVYGTIDTSIIFEPLVAPHHTVFNLCKYREDSENKNRIIQTNSYNGIFGFVDAKSGWYSCIICMYSYLLFYDFVARYTQEWHGKVQTEIVEELPM